MRFGRPHRHLRSCDSTNGVARGLSLAGAPDGTVVTADSQTAGRGRQGRAWATPPGGASLAYSAIHRNGDSPVDPDRGGAGRPGNPIGISPLLPLAVALATCEAIEALAPVSTTIKWPNDIWIERRKCAGILVEARPQDGWAVIGIGLNLTVSPDDLPPDARSRAISIGHGATPAKAIAELNAALSDWIERNDEAIVGAFRRRDALNGSRIGWAEGAGVAAGIDHGGNLIVRDDEGLSHTLSAGEVHLSGLSN